MQWRSAPGGGGDPAQTGPPSAVWWMIGILLVFVVAQFLWAAPGRVDQIDYSRFRQLLDSGQIERVVVSGNQITGTFKKPLTPKGPSRFETTAVDDKLAAELDKHGVAYEGREKGGGLLAALGWLLPFLLLIGFWVFMARRMGQGQGLGGLMQIGRSKAKIHLESDTGTTFDDVAGVDEAKQELRETVSFLRDPARYRRLGARQPRGILLVGPPGTGKTLLARAVAGEAGVPFFSISGSEFVEMFVGVGAARVRDLFEQARKHSPCIIFVDELDALGRARGGANIQGGQDEKEQTLNQLLNELDGFDPREGIVVLAASNQPQVLDPALLRAGRFDRQVLVDRPDKRGRLAILEVHVKKIVLAPEVDLEQVAGLTAGFSGADLENLVNEAAIAATRRDADAVTLEDFTAGIERLVAGLEQKSRVLSKRERRIIAYHELGHALVAWMLPGVDPVHKVSIIPRSIGALGFTMQRPTEDRYLMDLEELENKMAVLFGGRAAEELVFGRPSTGAADDIAKATEIARTLVTQYGMDERLGNVSLEDPRRGYLENPLMMPRQRRYGEETARAIDRAVRERLDVALERASAILEANRALLDRGAKRLLEHETLGHDALAELFAEARLPGRSAEAA